MTKKLRSSATSRKHWTPETHRPLTIVDPADVKAWLATLNGDARRGLREYFSPTPPRELAPLGDTLRERQLFAERAAERFARWQSNGDDRDLDFAAGIALSAIIPAIDKARMSEPEAALRELLMKARGRQLDADAIFRLALRAVGKTADEAKDAVRATLRRAPKVKR